MRQVAFQRVQIPRRLVALLQAPAGGELHGRVITVLQASQRSIEANVWHQFHYAVLEVLRRIHAEQTL